MSENTTRACPECDSADLRRRNPSHASSRADDDGLWRCDDCGASTDDPPRRARYRTASDAARVGLAARLEAADPEEVGR